jgi:iron complex outermembrane receptor protein
MIHTLFSRRTAYLLHCGVASAAMLFGSAALAQATGTAAQPKDPNKEPQTEAVDQQAAGGVANISSEKPVRGEEEIVVTGTLLRGAPPVGSNLISVGQEKIQSSGAQTSNELLSTIPQVTNLFNQAPSRRYGIAVNQLQIARPNLRNISADNASSNATLVLFDGHRVASAGVTQASIDPDLLPPSAIERVEVVTDGGSAIYGADAVGGVINFITRRKFDGVKVDARYGIANDYWSLDANAMVGKDWGSGSAYITYTFSRNDALFGRDRDFIRNIDFVTGAFTNNTCNAPNIAVGGVTFTRTGSTFAPGTTLCDASDNATFLPNVKRHGVMAAISQQLNDDISLDVRAFFSRRQTWALGEFTAVGVPITSKNFYYMQLPAGAIGATQTATLSLAPALGVDTLANGTKVREWGANAELKANLNSNWQLRTLLNYSWTSSSSFIIGPNQTLLNAAGAGTTAATALNPYNIAATDPQLLARIIDNDVFAGQSRDDLIDLRAILDGKLLQLPGGDVRLAVGYEYMFDEFKQRTGQNIVHGGLDSAVAFGTYRRRVNAVFGELQVPLFGESNATPGIYSFVISAQGRYDHYSDFGGTFNPKIGATYKPVRWAAIRGNWSKSFNAPTPLDQLGSRNNTIGRFPFIAFTRPGDNICFTCGITVALQGSQPNLRPQTAKTWSIGIDLDPPFIAGLHASLSYYNVVFKNQLRTPTPNVGIFTTFPDNIQTSVTGIPAATLLDFAQLAPNGLSVIQPIIAANTLVYEIVDFRTGNFGILKTDGLDWTVNYRHRTGFGGIDASFNGNYQLNRTTQVSPTAAVTDELLFNTSRLFMQTTLGVDIGSFRAQATWNHTGGFDVQRTSTLPQDHVSAFNTVNLFFKYDVKGERMFKDLSLTLNVNNVFDANPPVYKSRGAGGFLNGIGFTVGREFIFGISKKF